MYWTISLGWSIVGTVFLWIILSNRWNRLDHFHRVMIRQIRIFHQIPGTDGYFDLKFSVLRHAVVFLVSAIFMSWARVGFFTTTITFLNLVYCYFPIARYRFRKKEVLNAENEGSTELASFMSILVRDSFCCVLHAVISAILLYILILFK